MPVAVLVNTTGLAGVRRGRVVDMTFSTLTTVGIGIELRGALGTLRSLPLVGAFTDTTELLLVRGD
jgi:hypothetical protein